MYITFAKDLKLCPFSTYSFLKAAAAERWHRMRYSCFSVNLHKNNPFHSIIFHASEILWKEPHRKKTWVTNDVLDVCDERRDLKNMRHEAEGAKDYKEANRRIQKVVKKEKEDWIGVQCEEIETCLNINTSERAYQLV